MNPFVGISFWTLPVSALGRTPCSSAATMYVITSSTAPFTVIDTDIRPSGIPLKRISMSSTESMATPTLPTSLVTRGWSESSPRWVARSNAIDNPVCPASRPPR